MRARPRLNIPRLWFRHSDRRFKPTEHSSTSVWPISALTSALQHFVPSTDRMNIRFLTIPPSPYQLMLIEWLGGEQWRSMKT